MKEFEPYVNVLESLVGRFAGNSNIRNLLDEVDAALDGQPGDELRKRVPLSDLRESGAFFTGSELSKVALEPMFSTLKRDSKILDPACGAGDLLIACARQLANTKDIAHTMDRWGAQLIGRDLHTQFIEATKLRLTLAAVREGSLSANQNVSDFHAKFPGIKQGSGLTDHEAIQRATHIVVNPPFTQVGAPENCEWASGKVNAAALFLETCVTHARPETKIVAILPDVLRSGTRYGKWRRTVTEQAFITRLELYGQFDESADVDVFVVELDKVEGAADPTSDWGQPASVGAERIKDHCNVCVGPVVNYRDPHRGARHLFIQSRNLPAWQALDQITARRKFSGKVLEPPFVVVRRTSRVGDKYRAIGTIIAGTEPVAVENHLLILAPNDRTIETCRRVLSVLRNANTTRWLDQSIRCRHLTVSSVENLPWWDDD